MFDHTLRSISTRVGTVSLIFIAVIIVAGVIIALSHSPAAAADHDGDARDHLRQPRSPRAGYGRQGRGRRDGARGRGVPRECDRQADGGRRSARVEGEGRERAGRTARDPAEPDRRGAARRARRPRRRRRARGEQSRRHQPDGGVQLRTSRRRFRAGAAVEGAVAPFAARGVRAYVEGCFAATGRQPAARGRIDPVVQAGRGRPLARRAAGVRPAGGDRADRGKPASGAEEGRRSRCR